MTMTWRAKVEEWKSGNYLTTKSSPELQHDFVYETSVCYPEGPYREEFQESLQLDRMPYDSSPFSGHLRTKTVPYNPYATMFKNLSGESILIIPRILESSGPPANNPQAQFKSIKEFMEQATPEHQKHFWKYVAYTIDNLWALGVSPFYVSTHGLGLGYFHLRIDPAPKYYITGAASGSIR